MRYLGLDIGSVSFKGVIIDENLNILKSCYIKNEGLIPTTKKVLLNLKIDDTIDGVGITGSGKEFIKALIGSDIVESEIIAHYIATMTLHKDTRTIIDIGGEDSKIMLINKGVLTSFHMNQSCGGGSGAMIESIATRMNIKLEDISKIALESKTEVIISSKCGIFAQSAVVSKLNKGVPKEDILMGLCRGLVSNYLAMLCKGVNLKPPYVFQGATAKNKALVKCFEDELGEKIFVPSNPEFMGALGMAILVKDEIKGNSIFKGFDLENKDFQTKTFISGGCSNRCEITKIIEDGKLIAHIGNRCEKCI